VRLAVVLALFVGCIYESGGQRIGGTGGAGGGPVVVDASPSACNPVTGMGCLCGTCPVPTDMCFSLGTGGSFCSNACVPGNDAVTCALLPGQPGRGVCALSLTSPDAGPPRADHCIVVCDNFRNCPAGMVAQTIQGTCVCVGP
jgi:hypothetical protein